jgi:NAD(P)H-dependent flavin oxidoreductase YrpB (nitropropane dioxygenase family)
LALGAEGVIMGTPLLVSEECPIHPRLKQALIEANELDTMIVMRSIGNTHRVWINEAANKIAELEKQQAGLEAVVEAAGGDRAKKMYEGGDIQGGIISCGQGIGLVKKVMPMKEIIEKIVNQADALRKKLAAN